MRACILYVALGDLLSQSQYQRCVARRERGLFNKRSNLIWSRASRHMSEHIVGRNESFACVVVAEATGRGIIYCKFIMSCLVAGLTRLPQAKYAPSVPLALGLSLRNPLLPGLGRPRN